MMYSRNTYLGSVRKFSIQTQFPSYPRHVFCWFTLLVRIFVLFCSFLASWKISKELPLCHALFMGCGVVETHLVMPERAKSKKTDFVGEQPDHYTSTKALD